MGNWVTVEAFRNLRMDGEGHGLGKKVGVVVLASPDIDVDVFRSQMARTMGPQKKPFLIVVSQDDRALAVSRFIAGDKDRVGDYRDAADLTRYGAIVVDLSDVEGESPSNHDKVAELATFAPRLNEVLAKGVDQKDPVMEDVGPAQNVPGVVKRFLSLPAAIVLAPVSVISRAARQ